MYTIKDKLIGELTSRGMSQSQANKVIEDSKEELKEVMNLEDYSINLNDSAGAYPKIILNIVFAGLKPLALKWIEKNIPLAWYKPMFQID